MTVEDDRNRTVAHGDPLELQDLAKKPVVVGVDGSERNVSAIEWAAREAARTDRPLVLVLAADVDAPITTFSAASHLPPAMDAIRAAQGRVAETDPSIQVVSRTVTGPPAEVLVEAARHAAITVVGRRGRGTFARLLAGSTSTAVAGHASGVVVVVPDEWDSPRQHHRPILVGVDLEAPDHAALDFAYMRANALKVDLVAVASNEPPWTISYDPFVVLEAMEDRTTNQTKLLSEALQPHATDYPGVVSRLTVRQFHPAQAVVDEARFANAQLIVLGARAQRRLTGFPLGSVTRAVLHHADCPVAVVHPAAESKTSG